MSYLRKMAAQSFIDYQATYKSMNPILKLWKNFEFDNAYYPQIGLKTDDTYMDSDVLKEALKRLPREELEKRNFRINTAFQLSMNKEILPKDQWIKIENDDRYLTPYMDLVKKEMADYHDWDFK